MAKVVGQQNELPQTTPLVIMRIPQLKVKQEGDFSSRQTLDVFVIPKLLFSTCFGWVLAQALFLPSPSQKKQSKFFSMIRANTNKCFAGCSSPLLKYIGCTYITYPSLSEVTVSLEALLGLWHFVRQASKKFNSQRYYSSLTYLLTLKVQSN